MPQPSHHRFNLCHLLELKCNWAREKVIPHFLYWLPWRGALSVFAFINLRYPIQCKVSQDPKESHTQIQSARSQWGTRMNSSTEGPDTSFADILVENHLCLILRQSLFQRINIVWPIINKCINHYYQTHKTLSISRSPSLNNFRHYENIVVGVLFLWCIRDIFPSVERVTQKLSTRLWKTLTFYIVVRGRKRNWRSLL